MMYGIIFENPGVVDEVCLPYQGYISKCLFKCKNGDPWIPYKVKIVKVFLILMILRKNYMRMVMLMLDLLFK